MMYCIQLFFYTYITRTFLSGIGYKEDQWMITL